jgi:hypothetical protein
MLKISAVYLIWKAEITIHYTIWAPVEQALLMIILIKLFLNSKLDLIRPVKFVKQLFKIQIQKGKKVLFWNQVKSRTEACYSELVLQSFLQSLSLNQDEILYFYQDHS